MSDEIAKATQQAMILEKAIKRATTDKGISYYSLNAELQKAGTSAAKLTATLASGGQQFTASLNAANVALAQSDRTLISLSAKIKEMSRVMVQSFKFTAAQATLQAISNAAREAYQWVYELDKTITNIGVVTGYTGDQLDKVTQNAIAGAKELRIAANDYAEGALIFYQQGLGDDEVARRVEITAKSARAAGQSLEAMSSQLTAIWNTYRMTGDEMERAASVGAKMAGDTAVDFADIAEAMQTAAAPAEQMGVSYNSLAAIIATVGDTTQQSASVIGNAFKTIFSRFQQLKAEGTDGEVTLNRVSSQLQSLGINVLDASGELRNLDTVIMEVGTQWDSWSQKQQLAVAQLVGGTRQYGQFLTLMQNFDKYQDLLQSANAEDGSALEQQYASSLDSIESRAENAGEAWRRAFGSLIDEDMIKDVLGAVEVVGNGLDQVFETLGDTKGVALYIATIFAKQWIPSITKAAANLKTLATNLTPKQRERNINREYDQNSAEIDAKMTTATSKEEQTNLQIQKQKNEYGRQTAIINDKINTSLKTANRYQQIILNFEKEKLTYAQEQYQSALDRLNVLAQEADRQQKLLSIEEQQARAEEQKARAILQGYQQKLAQAQNKGPTKTEYNQAVKTKSDPNASAEAIKKADQIIAQYNKKLAECERLTRKVEEASDKAFEATLIRKSTQEVTSLQQKLIKARGEVAKYASTGKQDYGTATKAVQSFAKAVQKATGKVPEDLLGKNIAKKTPEELNKILSQLYDILEAAGKVNEVMSKINSEGVDAGEQKGKSEQDQKDVGEAPPPSPEGDNLPQKIDFTSIMTGAAETAGAIAMIGTVWSNTMNTLMSDSASASEKIFGLLSAFAMTVPMVTSLNNGVVLLGKAFGILAKEEEGATAITVISNVAHAAKTKLLQNEKIATVATTVATKAQAVADTAHNVVLAIKAALLAIINKEALSTAATIAIVIAAIVALIAIITALVKIVQFFVNLAKEHSLEAKLESAKESAEMFASALEDAKTEAEALKSAFDSYEDVKKTLDECAQGTQEWEDALRAVNDQVLQLMTDYPELAGMVNEQGEKAITRNETTGELEVADWAMEQMENEANQKVQNTQAASIHANQEVRQAEIDISKNDAKMGFASNEGLTALAENSDVFTLTGEDLVNRISEIFAENGINEDAQKYADAISKNTEAAIALAQEVRSNTIATETENDVLAQAALEGTDYEGTDLAMSQAGTQYQSDYDAEYEKAYKQITDRGWFNTGTDTSKAIFERYAAETGLDQREDFEVTNYRGDGDVDIKYTDENGDEQTETIKAEDVANFIAGADASKELANSMGTLDTDVQNLANSTNDATQANEAAATAITEGDLGSLSKDQIEDLKNVATTPEAMSKFLQDNGMSQENADIYGQELYDQVHKIDWDEILEDVNIPDSAIANFTTKQAQNLGKAYEQLGEVGGEQMQSTMDTIITEASKKGLGDEVAEKLGEVDFTSWESIEEFQDYLNSIGLDFETLGIDIDAFADKLQDADGVVRSVDPTSVAQKYSEIFDMGKDLQIGDTITQTDYDKLDENMKTFFTDMGDGTYQLTKSAEDFLSTVKENEKQALMDEAEKAMQNYEDARYASYTSTDEREQALDVNYDSLVQAQTAVLGTATSLEELDATMAQLQQEMGVWGVDIQAYSAALINLASQYDNTTQEIEDYRLALATGSEEQIAAAEDAVRGATYIGEAAEKYGLETDNLEAQAKQLAKTYDLSAEEAARLATNNQRMNKGISQLAENWEDWSDTLKNTDKTSQDYAEVVADLTETLGDLTGAADDFEIPEGFLDSEENLRLIGEAAQGSQEAINQLGNALAYAAVEAMTFNAELAASLGSNIDATQFESYKNTVLTGIDQLKGKLGELQVGQDVTSILGSNWVDALNQMALATGMSVDQMNGLLGQLGVQAKVETKSVKQEMEVPTYTEVVEPGNEVEIVTGTNPDGSPHTETIQGVKRYTVPGEPQKVMGYVQVAQISTDENPMTPDITFVGTGGGNAAGYSPRSSGTGGGGGKGGGGGSGSKPTKKKAEKRDSMKVEDRYSTVKAAIDDVQREMDKFSANQDDMWGGAKLNALKKYNKELHKQAGYYRELVEQAKNYLETEDKPGATKARQAAANALGAGLIGIEYYEEGYVKNRTEIINQLDDLLQAKYDEYYNAAMAYDAAVDAGTATEAQSEAVDNLKTEYEDTEKVVNEYVEALDQIDDTAKEAEEALQKLVEAIREEIANKVEEITYKIELQVEINDLELEQIERTIEHLGDVGVLTGKKFGLLSQSFRESQESANLAVQGIRQLEGMINNLNTAAGQEQFIKVYGQEAWDKYAASGVLPEEAIDGIKDYIGDLTSAIDDMYSKMEDMFDTYLDLLDMYIEKFDQIADKISRNSNKLDMYEQLLEFSGQQWTSEGQTARNTIAEARVSTAQANITLAQSKFETTKGQYDEWMEYVDEFQREHGKDIENYDEATAAAWNKIEETRKTLYDEMTASEEEIYANMQDFVDSVADAIEVGAEVIKEQIADSLGGLFYDFDSMMENYDQMETLRLFFLEDYDKNYQLESLLRDIDDAMADVTDPGRLEEYNKLIDEINASNAEGVQITQNDVDLLKAKFELQKAQDAYEEAQNAKNTMRLARDASGNWNYVYSQDQSQTEDAAQALADAQYNYDKLLHEVRDESSQLWLQTQQEFYQWQSEIDQSRLQWDLEYRQSVEQTTAYYLEMTQRYADQVEKYNGLLGESYSETTLGVVTNFGEMQDAQDFYTQKHQEYNAKLEENTKKWEGVMDEECEKVGLDYTQLAKDVTTEATKIMNENSQLESDVQNLQQVASKALTSMSKNVQSNVNSMISAIQRLEAELRRAIQLLETLTNKSLMSGYDENTDYTDYLHTDYAAYQAAGGKMEMGDWLDMYHSQDIWERMGAGADRGIYSGKEYEEAKDLIVDSYNPDATYINGNQYNFGEGTSGKYLNDWSGIKEQEAKAGLENLEKEILGKRANGGIVTKHGLYELAENGTEFVLNPDDTKNILAAVSQMREVVKMKMQGLNGNLSKQTAGVTEKTVIDKDVQQVEQAVHIDATFPNVSVAKEIEEAFSNLVNQAVQYASAQKNSRQG